MLAGKVVDLFEEFDQQVEAGKGAEGEKEEAIKEGQSIAGQQHVGTL
jgi:hypothetical protein